MKFAYETMHGKGIGLLKLNWQYYTLISLYLFWVFNTFHNLSHFLPFKIGFSYDRSTATLDQWFYLKSWFWNDKFLSILTFAGDIRSVPGGLAVNRQTFGPREAVGYVTSVTVVLNSSVQVEGGLLGESGVTSVLDGGGLETVDWNIWL